MIVKDIREKGKFPSDFDEKVGEDADEIKELLLKLINPNPEKRPSAEELHRKYDDK